MTSHISGTKHHETLLCLDGSHDLQWEGQITKRTNLFRMPDQSSVAMTEVVACICLLLFVVVTYDFLTLFRE